MGSEREHVVCRIAIYVITRAGTSKGAATSVAICIYLRPDVKMVTAFVGCCCHDMLGCFEVETQSI